MLLKFNNHHSKTMVCELYEHNVCNCSSTIIFFVCRIAYQVWISLIDIKKNCKIKKYNYFSQTPSINGFIYPITTTSVVHRW